MPAPAQPLDSVFNAWQQSKCCRGPSVQCSVSVSPSSVSTSVSRSAATDAVLTGQDRSTSAMARRRCAACSSDRGMPGGSWSSPRPTYGSARRLFLAAANGLQSWLTVAALGNIAR